MCKRRVVPRSVLRATLLAALFTLSLGIAGCGGQPQKGSGESGGGSTTIGSEEPSTVEESGSAEQSSRENTGESTARSGSGDTEGTSRESRGPVIGSQGVTLRVGGEPGLRFSGSCVVDGEERELGREVPRTYTYEPQERLRCEIFSRERGPLRLSFSDGEGTNALQQVGPQPATVELTYTEDGLSTSTRSSSTTSSQSSSQNSSSSMSSSQSSSQSSSARSGSE